MPDTPPVPPPSGLPPPRPPPRRAVLPPSPPPRRFEGPAAFLLALALLSAFAGVRDLWDADEGRYASVALDMMRADDLVTPRENGMRFVDKPPLLYWMAIGAYRVLGPTPFAARLPDLVAGAAWCALAFAFAATWTGRRRAGWLAAAVGATCLGGMGFSRSVTMDMPLAACVAGACLAAWRALASPGWPPRAALGLCVGLGLLVKGPLGAVAPGVVGLAWIAAGARAGAVLRLLVSPTAWAVALAVAAPWYVAMERANPGYLEHFVLYEHWGRLSRKGNRDFAPVWLYLATLPALLLPWTHALVRARLPGPVEGAWLRGPRPAGRFAWAWALGLLVFYSVGRNRLYTYILPALLPLVVLVAARIEERLFGDDPRGPMRLAAWASVFGGVASVAAVLLRSEAPFAWGLRAMKEVRASAAGGPVIFGALGLLLMPVLFRLLRTPRARATALVGATAIFWWSVDLGAAAVDAVRSPRALASLLECEQRAGADLVCLDVFPQGLRFYENVYVRIAGKQGEIVEPWAGLDGDGVLITPEELQALWRGPGRVVLVVRAGKAAPFARGSAELLGERLSGGQRSDLVVLANRPRR